MVGIGRGWYETGDATFHYYNHDSGPLLASKLDSGDLDIAVLGSAPFAEFAARGADLGAGLGQRADPHDRAAAVVGEAGSRRHQPDVS